MSKSVAMPPLAKGVEKRCAYCYKRYDRDLRCGQCRKRMFCSKTCQVADWRAGHKRFCGIAGELGFDFDIHPAAGGKGLGMFALKDLPRGATIMAERPLLHRVNQPVPRASQHAVAALVPRGGSLHMKFRLNAMANRSFMPCSTSFPPSATSSIPPMGLYVDMARVNHDCVGNSQHIFLAAHGVKILVASRQIAKGEEITIAYAGRGQGSSMCFTRREHLAMVYRFWCTCPACTDPSLGNSLLLAEALDEKIALLPGLIGTVEAFKVALDAGQVLIRIYDKLGEAPLTYTRTYYDMFQVAVTMTETLSKARTYVREAAKQASLACGEDFPCFKLFRMLAEFPERHPMYLLLEKL